MSFVDQALDSLKTGATFQASLNDIITDTDFSELEKAEFLANKCAEFKTVGEDWIAESGLYKEELKVTRKRLNNIINDISRTCRNELGYTIKCTSRKDRYVYEASVYVKPKPREEKLPVPTEWLIDTLTPPPVPEVSVLDQLSTLLDTAIKDYDIDVVGQLCVSRLNAAKVAEASV